MLLDRPAPQAIWPAGDQSHWRDAGAVFQRGEGGTGKWETKDKTLPSCWLAKIGALTFEIRLTGFGNVGLFPEHVTHWKWMADCIATREGAEVLNLFAYTGGASMACAAAGASVTHVDAAKSVNAWAKRNAELSGIRSGAIRYLAEDVMKITRRESRRGRRYDGIIIDPPTFGRGTKGEVWKIETDFFRLLEICQGLLKEDPLFLIITSHSPGITPSVLETLLAPMGPNVEAGEMILAGKNTRLPAGVYARCKP